MTEPAQPRSDDGPAPCRPGRLRQVVQLGLSLGLAVAIITYVLGSAADVSEVSAAISSMTGLELLTLALIAVWNLATYWIVVVAATPGLTYPQAAVLVESTTAVANAVPGGSAIAVGLTYGILGSWGFSRSRSTLSVVVSGLWNNFAKLALPVLALALLAMQGDVNGPRVTAGLFGIAALVASVTLFALMALSRTYLGVHWLSDVVAGTLLGVTLAVGWPALLQEVRERRMRRHASTAAVDLPPEAG